MPTEFMQCMEVWGGNQETDRAVQMAGLDAWVVSRPYNKSAGGGDVYYVSSCATGRITRLLVADVSGHGDAVAETASVLRLLMRRFVNFIDQGRFVKSMNEQFTAMSASNCFATAVVATFFSPTGHTSVCNAGHPPPLLYRAGTAKWSVLVEKQSPRDSAANIPLGILDMTDYEQFDVNLRAGDQVLCYTDSLIESKDESGEMLGVAGLLEVVKKTQPAQGKEFMTALLENIDRCCPGNLNQDDVTVLLVRANGKGRMRFTNSVLAPFRVARGLVRAAIAGEKLPWPEISMANLGGAVLNPLNWTNRKPKDEDEDHG